MALAQPPCFGWLGSHGWALSLSPEPGELPLSQVAQVHYLATHRAQPLNSFVGGRCLDTSKG